MPKDKIIYKNEPFYLMKNKKYYNSGRKDKNVERLLHRRIWFEHYGKIPDNHHIHHKNGDWKDNRIENLECLHKKEHHRIHMIERFNCEKYRAENKVHLLKAQEQAKKWHSSEEGKKFHSENGKKVNEKRKVKDYVCVICTKDFQSKSFGRVYCCSLSCTIKNRNNKQKIKKDSCYA